MSPGGLRETDGGGEGFGEDGYCAECRTAIAAGPCAACESMICPDCGVMSQDPVAQRVICLSCARLIVDVGARPPRRPASTKWIAIAVLIAFAATGLALLTNCGGSTETMPRTTKRAHDRAPTPRVADAGVADAAPTPRPVRMLRAVAPPGGAGGITGAAVVARVFAFADTQIHYMYGKRTFAQSPFADRMAFEVAVRPAALDDGSDLLLDAFLRDYRAHYASHSLVFLGDAADQSCTQEFTAFKAVLARAGLTQLLGVTSNHDGFFVGNFTSKRDLGGNLRLTDMPRDWTRACSLPGSFTDRRLTRGRAAARLLSMLPPAPAWATASAHRGATGPSQYKAAHLYYVRALRGGDKGAPPGWGVFLDTVDYRGFDLSGARGAGTVGAIHSKQLRFLDRAMFEARNAEGVAPVTFLAFGHHPVEELEGRSRDRLLRFLDAHPRIVAYVAAHTHRSDERTLTLPSGRTLPELIVGSTTDAPQAARVLELQYDAKTGRRSVRSHRLVLDLGRTCRGVTPMPQTQLGYTGYRFKRDGTPDLTVGLIDKLMVGIGLDDLASKRLVQVLGAMAVENELVRSLAKLYLDAPIALDAAQRRTLTGIVAARYAAGPDLRALRPWLSGRARTRPPTRYEAWNDPTVAHIAAVAEQGLHRFGRYRQLFRRLRPLRSRSKSAHDYFLCHASRAAVAEARTPRTRDKNVVFIR